MKMIYEEVKEEMEKIFPYVSEEEIKRILLEEKGEAIKKIGKLNETRKIFERSKCEKKCRKCKGEEGIREKCKECNGSGKDLVNEAITILTKQLGLPVYKRDWNEVYEAREILREIG